MKAAQTKLEKQVLSLLSGDVPQPKYQLWQMTTRGRIVGICWESIEVAFEAQTVPGWIYICERQAEHEFIAERKVKLIEEAGAAA